jgi:hypothetical protein
MDTSSGRHYRLTDIPSKAVLETPGFLLAQNAFRSSYERGLQTNAKMTDPAFGSLRGNSISRDSRSIARDQIDCKYGLISILLDILIIGLWLLT